MPRWIRQSTSVDVPIGPFLDATDGITAETGLTLTQPDVRLKKNGGAWAQKNAAQTLSHEENGYYEVALDDTDTATLGLLRLAVNEAGALPVWEDFLVVPANVWDSLFGSDLLQVDITQHLGSVPNALVSGRFDASVGAMAANVLTATAINADAITDAKVASDVTIASVTGAVGSVTGAVGSVTGAVGSVTGNVGGNVTGSVGSIATGGITAASLAADAITAAKVAADVTTEIQSGLATAANLATLAGYVDTEVAAIITTLGTPAGASLAADIAAIEAQTDDIGVAGAGLTAVPWNAAWDAEVQSEVQDAIEVNHLDHLLAVTYDPASKPGAADALLNELVESDAGVARYTANALELAPTGGSAPTAEANAAAVRTNLTTELGRIDAAVTTRASQASLDTLDDLVDTEVAAIKAKTDNLPSDPADQSLIIAATDAIVTAVGTRASQTSVDDVPTNTELATALGTADDAILAAITALNNLSTAQLATALATYDGPTKAEMDAAVALLATAANLALVKAKTDSLTFTIAGVVDSNLQRVNDVVLVGDGDATPWGPA